MNPPVPRTTLGVLYALVVVQMILFGAIAAGMSRNAPAGALDILDDRVLIAAVAVLLIAVAVMGRIVLHDAAERSLILKFSGVAAAIGVFLALSLPEEARIGPRFWMLTQGIFLFPLAAGVFGAALVARGRRSVRVMEALRLGPVVLHTITYGVAALTLLSLWGWIETEIQETHQQQTPALSVLLLLGTVLVLLYLARRR